MPNCSGLKVIIAKTIIIISAVFEHTKSLYAKENKTKKTVFTSEYIVILSFKINSTFERLKYTPLEWCYSDKWREFRNKRLILGIDNCMYKVFFLTCITTITKNIYILYISQTYR